MQRAKTLLLASSLLFASTLPSFSDVNVVASIKPIHSLVAAVMEGVGTPDLIVDGAASPHNFALKPSQAQMLQQATVVFWIGHALETFLEKPLETVGANAKSVELIEAPDLLKFSFRHSGAFEKHDDQAKEADAEDDHGHGAFDAHIWLDPVNANAIVNEIAKTLIAVDPLNAAKYEVNARAVSAKIDTLTRDVSTELATVKGNGFIVFHDAYQYFENRFGLAASGSITISPDVMPGAERITEIRARIAELGATCVFAEPQFEPKLISTVIEGTKAKFGIIDPLGANLPNGPDLYFQVIQNMATSIKTCLSEAR